MSLVQGSNSTAKEAVDKNNKMHGNSFCLPFKESFLRLLLILHFLQAPGEREFYWYFPSRYKTLCNIASSNFEMLTIITHSDTIT